MRKTKGDQTELKWAILGGAQVFGPVESFSKPRLSHSEVCPFILHPLAPRLSRSTLPNE